MVVGFGLSEGRLAESAAALTSPVNPVTISKRVCDVLLSFPEAAIGGVRWGVVVRKYEERHATRLDLTAFGQQDATPLVAATTLLWEVLRLVDASESCPDGPLVAVEDAIVLTPRAGALGTWPSLYSTLCALVRTHGAVMHLQSSAKDGPAAPEEQSRSCQGLLLSRLKPLLQQNWHRSFEEHGLGFLNGEGSHVRLKKMKHLVQAILRWRTERLAWQKATGQKPTPVDAALREFPLALRTPDGHNDLMLCCLRPEDDEERHPREEALEEGLLATNAQQTNPPVLPRAQSLQLSELEEENARLRAENQLLRMGGNSQGEHPPAMMPQQQLLLAPFSDQISEEELLHQQEQEIFDNPFEPPPEAPSKHREALWISLASSGCTSVSTSFPSSLQSSGCATPVSRSAGTNPTSTEESTPIGGGAQQLQVSSSSIYPSFMSSAAITFCPSSMFLPPTQHLYDLVAIPRGIVDKYRGQIEGQASLLGQAIPLPGPLWTQTAGLDRLRN